MVDMMDQIDVLMSRVTDTYTNKAIECGLEDLDIRKMESDISKLSIEADRLMQAGNVIRAQGMTRSLAVALESIDERLLGGKVIGSFTERPSETNRKVALEEISKLMMVGLTALTALVAALITKLVNWIMEWWRKRSQKAKDAENMKRTVNNHVYNATDDPNDELGTYKDQLKNERLFIYAVSLVEAFRADAKPDSKGTIRVSPIVKLAVASYTTLSRVKSNHTIAMDDLAVLHQMISGETTYNAYRYWLPLIYQIGCADNVNLMLPARVLLLPRNEKDTARGWSLANRDIPGRLERYYSMMDAVVGDVSKALGEFINWTYHLRDGDKSPENLEFQTKAFIDNYLVEYFNRIYTEGSYTLVSAALNDGDDGILEMCAKPGNHGGGVIGLDSTGSNPQWYYNSHCKSILDGMEKYKDTYISVWNTEDARSLAGTRDGVKFIHPTQVMVELKRLMDNRTGNLALFDTIDASAKVIKELKKTGYLTQMQRLETSIKFLSRQIKDVGDAIKIPAVGKHVDRIWSETPIERTTRDGIYTLADAANVSLRSLSNMLIALQPLAKAKADYDDALQRQLRGYEYGWQRWLEAEKFWEDTFTDGKK